MGDNFGLVMGAINMVTNGSLHSVGWALWICPKVSQCRGLDPLLLQTVLKMMSISIIATFGGMLNRKGTILDFVHEERHSQHKRVKSFGYPVSAIFAYSG